MEIDNPEEIKADEVFKAAESGDSSVFDSLSPQNLLKILSFRNEDQRSLLHVAASSGRTQVLTSLPFNYYNLSLLFETGPNGWVITYLYFVLCSDNVELVF